MPESPPASAADFERALTAHLPLIGRCAGYLGRRYGLSATAIEEFESWSIERLIEGDYAILRKFAGRSTLGAYLRVVLVNLFRDFCNSQWGRWRPSAAAKRLGPTAVQLEKLTGRDGHSVAEAVQVLVSRGASASAAELTRLAAKFPARVREREVDLDAASAATTSSAAESIGRADRESAEGLLASLIGALPSEDAVLIRLKYWRGLKIADIARALGLEQKPLYRRLESIEIRLRAELERHGIDRSQLVEIYEEDADAWSG